MDRTATTARLRRIAGETRARREHFRTEKAVRGELERKGVDEAIERFDGDAEFLEQLARELDAILARVA
jgi:hypothetical protein